MRNTMRKAGYLVLPGSTRDVLPGAVKYLTNDHGNAADCGEYCEVAGAVGRGLVPLTIMRANL
jgi:hypothetical protein